MGPEYIAIAGAAIGLLQKLIPQIADLFAKGEISKEDQAKVMADYKALKENMDDKFSGPEWQQSGRTE